MRSLRPALEPQRGSVTLLMLGVLSVLLGFLALALDLSRLYQASAWWQQAVDSASLGGARWLDGTAAGALVAANQAIQTLTLEAQSDHWGSGWDPTAVTVRVGQCSVPSVATSSTATGVITAAHWIAAAPGCTFQAISQGVLGSGTGSLASGGWNFLELDSGRQPALAPWFAGLVVGESGQTGLTPYGYAVAGGSPLQRPLLFR